MPYMYIIQTAKVTFVPHLARDVEPTLLAIAKTYMMQVKGFKEATADRILEPQSVATSKVYAGR